MHLMCAVANPDRVAEFVKAISDDPEAYDYKPVSRLPAVSKVELDFLPGQTDAPSAPSLRVSSSLNLFNLSIDSPERDFNYMKVQRIPGPFVSQVILKH